MAYAATHNMMRAFYVLSNNCHTGFLSRTKQKADDLRIVSYDAEGFS